MINGIKLRSGQTGWRARLREIYATVEQLEDWDRNYGLLERLKFTTAEEAWNANPIIEGGTDPADYGVVTLTPGPWRWWMEKVTCGSEKGKEVRRALLGPGRGQFVMDCRTVQLQSQSEPEHVYLQVNRADEATVLSAPMLLETFRELHKRFADNWPENLPGVPEAMKVMRVAIDVAEGVRDPEELREALYPQPHPDDPR